MFLSRCLRSKTAMFENSKISPQMVIWPIGTFFCLFTRRQLLWHINSDHIFGAAVFLFWKTSTDFFGRHMAGLRQHKKRPLFSRSPFKAGFPSDPEGGFWKSMGPPSFLWNPYWLFSLHGKTNKRSICALYWNSSVGPQLYYMQINFVKNNSSSTGVGKKKPN